MCVENATLKLLSCRTIETVVKVVLHAYPNLKVALEYSYNLF